MGQKLGAVPVWEMGSWVSILHDVAWAEACLPTKWHLDPSNHLATIHQRHRQTGETEQIGQTYNGLIASGEPFYKWLHKKPVTIT